MIAGSTYPPGQKVLSGTKQHASMSSGDLHTSAAHATPSAASSCTFPTPQNVRLVFVARHVSAVGASGVGVAVFVVELVVVVVELAVVVVATKALHLMRDSRTAA